MANDTFLNFCNMFYNSFYIPLHYFGNNKLVLQLPVHELFYKLVSNYIQPLLKSERNITYLTTKDFSYYGIVKSKSDSKYIIIGPIVSTVCSKNTLKNIMAEAYIPHKYLNELFDLFQLFPVITFNQFLHILALVNLELNHENIKIEDIFDIESTTVNVPIDYLHTISIYQNKEEQNIHNTYNYEHQLLKFVENGDVHGLKNFIKKPIPIKAGIIADSNLRQMKNLFIVTTTIITRAAIRGGLDIETAYELSDTYILQMEKMQNINDVNQLLYAMLEDFTKRVSNSKIPEGISADIYKCIQFISTNTNNHINVSDVAKYVGKSRSYISSKFKAEMGFDLSAFIMRKKLEEAKSLLAFTDKSISEISYYLCFSSQNYFQNVFKKKFGITPNEYRNRSKHKE
ncbi:MAG: hypothetical protein ACFWTJ_14385 [Lachnoclostridium sp.]|jgi:AraC-like DNA-binding protein